MKELIFKTLALKLINLAISQLDEKIQLFWDETGEVISIETITVINIKRLQHYQNLAFIYLDAKANLEDNKPLSKENYTTIHNLLQGSTDGVFDNDKQLEDFKTYNDNQLKELL